MMSKLLHLIKGRVSQTTKQGMCILRVSSVPIGIIVAHFFVHASVPSTELCLEDTIANTEGKRKKGGRKSELAASTLPSRAPKRGRNCNVTPAFSGVPNAKRGEKIRIGCPNPAFSGAQTRAELLRNPCILEGPQRQARGENHKWLPHPHLLGGPKRGRNCCVNPAFSGVPNAKHGEKIRSGCLSPVFFY